MIGSLIWQHLTETRTAEPRRLAVMRKGNLVVVAIGGNALVPPGEHGTVEEEMSHARVVARDLARLIDAGVRLVVTHGNGPQVGMILRRSDLTAAVDPSLPRLPLSYCVAETQGGIGHLLANAIGNGLRERGAPDAVATVLMHAVVDRNDDAFSTPTKPIGAFYSAEEAEIVRRDVTWELVEDSGRGFRRVVASPIPLRLLEAPAVALLVKAGYVVVTNGGGGVPVVERADGTFEAVDAVMDKDRSSALLAVALGADVLVLSTSVERVALDYGRPSERALDVLTIEEAKGYLAEGQFPPGSMGPKILAAIEFLDGHGGEVIVTSLERVHDAIDGKTGTRIVRGVAAA